MKTLLIEIICFVLCHFATNGAFLYILKPLSMEDIRSLGAVWWVVLWVVVFLAFRGLIEVLVRLWNKRLKGQ